MKRKKRLIIFKNKRNNTDRLEIVKYCKFCKKRTTHKETKQFKSYFKEDIKWLKKKQRQIKKKILKIKNKKIFQPVLSYKNSITNG